MKLSEIYDQLAYGELRQVVMGTGDMTITALGIPQAKQQEILPFVILGLTEIHKRFKLREGKAILPLLPDKSDYSLATATDFMQVEAITGIWHQKPIDIPINLGFKHGITTPTYNTLTVPTDINEAPWLQETTELIISYRADHPVIDVNVASAAAIITDIFLPTMYLQALIYYISARVTSSLGGSEGYIETDSYQAKFEYQCSLLVKDSFNVEREMPDNKLALRGWV